jgi:mannose-1-phosphate guanylyltransferase
MDEHFYAVVMAGGGGTRMWPVSRKASPKQTLRLIGETSLFQRSVERLSVIFPPERIIVVTVAEQVAQLKEQCPFIPDKSFIVEPLPRGTASVVGLAAIAIQLNDPQAVMAVVTADHFIGNTELFCHLLMAAKDVARDDYLVTLGIEPTFPSTGYGYIQRGKLLGIYDGLNAFSVVKFKEKPDEEQAIEMLKDGKHAWNSGMFVWSVKIIMDEFERQMPDLSSALQEISKAWATEDQDSVLSRVWPSIESETIDYGIMEGAQKVAVIPAKGLDWSDVGSWDSLFGLLPEDDNGNIVACGNYINLDTRDSLVYIDKKDDERLFVTIGLEDMILVDTGDVVMVCPKDRAQDVREVVRRLKKTGKNYL